MPAAVQTPSEARAEARFREGSEAFDQGRVDDACAAFGESLHLFATLGTLLNLALCHEKQGRVATAWAEFVHAGAWATDRDRRDFAKQHAARLERSLPRLRVEVEGNAPVQVTLDGDSLSDARRAMPLFVDPGAHNLTAAAPGRRSFSTTVTIAPNPSGDAPVLVTLPELEPLPEAAPVAPAPPAPPAPSRSSRVAAGWIAGGVGGLALGAGVAFGIDALSRTESLGSRCTGECDFGPAKTAEAVSLAMLVTGAAGIAAGTWLLLGPARTSPRPIALYVAPNAAPHAAGLSLGGAW